MGIGMLSSEVQRAQIVNIYGNGLLERQMFPKIKVSKTVVHQVIYKFQQYGLQKDLKRSGKPRKSCFRDKHLMKRIVARSLMSSVKKIRAVLMVRSVRESYTIKVFQDDFQKNSAQHFSKLQ